jgi:arsenical pump membrane protein
VLVLLLCLCTVALVVWSPRGFGPARAAGLGAALALLLGVVHWSDLLTVWHATWNATFTLVGLIVISLMLDEAGFFRFMALHVARWGGGSGRRLFVLLVLFTALVSALFANDGGVLILTPIALELAVSLGLARAATLALALAVGFVVDAASLPLTLSNLVNIVVADGFGIGFGRYAAVMLPVNGVAVLASLGVLLWLSGRSLPRRYDLAALPAPAGAIRSRGVVLTGWVLLPILLAGYLLAEPLGLPLCLVTGFGAAVLWIAAGRSRAFSSRQVLRAAPWNVVVFSLAMYLVVYGLRGAGWTALYARLAEWATVHGLAAGVFAVGGSVAALSAFLNNLPAVLFASLGLEQAHLAAPTREALAFAAIVGADIGPKLTPIGSLATLLWLSVLARRGLKVGWGEYFRAGVVLTPPVLLAALAALTLVLAAR